MQIDIYITETEGSREIQIPWLPDRVEFRTSPARKAAYEILDLGEAEVPTGSNLASVSWEGILPGSGHKDLPFLRGGWTDPKNIQNTLIKWKEEGTKLRLLMTGTPINHDVYLDDFTASYSGGAGDVSYSIAFKARREIKITSTKVAAQTSISSGNNTRKTTPDTYTIKSGDTLWAIAQKYLGSGAKYKQIYDLNKTIIEENAKKHGKSSSDGGHWIYPGTVIKLPGGASAAAGSSAGSTGAGAKSYGVNITSSGNMAYVGEVIIAHTFNGKQTNTKTKVGKVAAMCDAGTAVKVYIYPASGHSFSVTDTSGAWEKQAELVYVISSIKADSSLNVKWSINKP